MFAYCNNNPICRLDLDGKTWEELGNWFKDTWEEFKDWAKDTFGAGSTTSITLYEFETPILQSPSPVTITSGTTATQTVSSNGDSSKPISVYADGSLSNPIKSSSAGVYVNIDNFTLGINLALDDVSISGTVTRGSTSKALTAKMDISQLRLGFETSSSISSGDVTSTSYRNYSVNGWTIIYLYLFILSGQEVPLPPTMPAPAN